jgi:hypothetical protein
MKLLNNLKLVHFSMSIFGVNNVMVAFPLEFFNFITDVQSFKIIPNFWPVKFFIINIIPFILTFWYLKLFIRYVYYWSLQFANNVIIMKSKVHLIYYILS